MLPATLFQQAKQSGPIIASNKQPLDSFLEQSAQQLDHFLHHMHLCLQARMSDCVITGSTSQTVTCV